VEIETKDREEEDRKNRAEDEAKSFKIKLLQGARRYFWPRSKDPSNEEKKPPEFQNKS